MAHKRIIPVFLCVLYINLFYILLTPRHAELFQIIKMFFDSAPPFISIQPMTNSKYRYDNNGIPNSNMPLHSPVSYWDIYIAFSVMQSYADVQCQTVKEVL